MAALPAWADWRSDCERYTIGVEEEAMLLAARDWSLAPAADALLDAAPPQLRDRLGTETHQSAVELRTGPHRTAAGVAAELGDLRARLDGTLRARGLRAAGAGLHPLTTWQETVVSTAPRYRLIHDSMRVLARREPTFALHVHVAVDDPEDAVLLANRMRGHLPLLLALSGNSPFWQGRDTAMASARTPIFQAFPRVGLPRRFDGYGDWVTTVDRLVRCGALPEPTFLWWDVRLQPSLGTVEVRILDAQCSASDTAALTALIQAIARLELEEGFVSEALLGLQETLEENRFIAARDGMESRFVAADGDRLVPARAQLDELLHACEPYAAALGCLAELQRVSALAERPGAVRQRDLLAACEGDLRRVVAELAAAFAPPVAATAA